VPVTGLAANFSPMPRIAPPPLGSEMVGTGWEDADVFPVGDASERRAASVVVGPLGARGACSPSDTRASYARQPRDSKHQRSTYCRAGRTLRVPARGARHPISGMRASDALDGSHGH
jgi:hypothetical protein